MASEEHAQARTPAEAPAGGKAGGLVDNEMQDGGNNNVGEVDDRDDRRKWRLE